MTASSVSQVLDREIGTLFSVKTANTTETPSHVLQEVRGKRVLELGCGVGLPGVAAAVVGATEVILTDMVRLEGIIHHTVGCVML